MEMTEQAQKPRRVGTFTLGVTLVIAGCCMMAGFFFPQFRPEWMTRAAPLILIGLGIETLLAAKGGGKIKYDWVGMILTFLLVCGAAGMYAVTWAMDTWPEQFQYYNGSMGCTEDGLFWEYEAFNGTKMQTIDLAAGDTLDVEISRLRGSVDVTIIEDEDRDILYEGETLPTGAFSVDVSKDSTYEVWLTGENAAGSARFSRGTASDE